MVTPLLKRRATVVTRLPWPIEAASNRLRLLIVVSACGAFVAVLRNHAEIVLARANRERPRSAVR